MAALRLLGSMLHPKPRCLLLFSATLLACVWLVLFWRSGLTPTSSFVQAPEVRSVHKLDHPQQTEDLATSRKVPQATRTSRLTEAAKPTVEVFRTTIDFDQFCTFLKLPRKQSDATMPTMTICTESPKVCGIAELIHRTHDWETHLINPFAEYLEKDDKTRGASQDKISLVDLGCNYGIFTLTAAALGYQGLAMDLQRSKLQALYTSLRKNNLTEQVTLVHNALSDRHEKLYLPDPSNDIVVPYDSNAKSERNLADAVMMDDVIPLVRTHRVFLKMDVEASEGRALRGGQKFFDAVDVVCVLMEWQWVKANSTDRDFILNFLGQRGYRAYNKPSSTDPLPWTYNMTWPHDIYWLRESTKN